ncbi:MAG: HMA2 domain-containing protein [Salinibacter sp.]
MPLTGSDSLSLADELDWTAVRVASFVPGRVRLKSRQLRDDEPLGTRIAEALEEVDAITEAAVNARTGSVLVCYDADRLEDLPSLIDRADAFGLLPDDVDPEELKAMIEAQADGTVPNRDFGGEVRSVFDVMDTSVKDATGGAMDLKGLVPLSLVGMGTYRLLSGAATQSLPWFNYFWFAFSIFVATGAGASPDAAADDGEPGGPPTSASNGEPAAAA